MTLSPTDKTDIVIALRKVATGLEQGDSKTFDLLEAIGTELLVLALKHALPAEPLAEGAVPMVPEAVEAVARREVSAIGDSVQRFLSHQVTERDILNERLMRQFDPSMAWNEAINRAIDAKKAAKQEIVLMTPQQAFAFEQFQKPSTMMAFKNAGAEVTAPTVHRISGMMQEDGRVVLDNGGELPPLHPAGKP
jgi:hypothetical protein